MEPMSQHFDVAVVGTQLSGIIAAALIAKRGRRVVLVDHGEQTNSYRRNGFRLPLIPTLVPNLDDSPPAKIVHQELALGPQLRAKLETPTTSFQAIMPGHRIDVRSSPEAWLGELKLEFPELVDQVRDFFTRLIQIDGEISAFLAQQPKLLPSGFFDGFKVKRTLAEMEHLDVPFEEHPIFQSIPTDHPIREVLLGPLSFFGNLSAQSPSAFHAIRLIARYYRGTVTFTDRLFDMADVFVKAAEEAGVTVRRGALVKTIQPNGAKLHELELADGRHSFTADFFIDNATSPFEELLPQGKAQAKLAAERSILRPVGSLMVLNILAKREVVPNGMAESVFLLNGRQQQRGNEPADPPLFLRRYPAQRIDAQGSRKVDDDQHVVFSVACPVRTSEITRSPARMQALRAQMASRVARLVPFLNEYIVDQSIASDTSAWDADTDMTRTIDPWALHPIYEPSERPVLGIAVKREKGYFKNLVRCGRDVIPGLGLEGEYVAALAAVDEVTDRAGSAWKSRN